MSEQEWTKERVREAAKVSNRGGDVAAEMRRLGFGIAVEMRCGGGDEAARVMNRGGDETATGHGGEEAATGHSGEEAATGHGGEEAARSQISPPNLHASSAPAMITLLMITVQLLSVSAASQQNFFPIAKPNCVDHCGNVSIPFPFGTTQECYKIGDYFGVNCDETYDPPKLFWDNTSIEFTDISLDGQARVLRPLARDCSDKNSVLNDNSWISLAKYFTVNNTANKFTMVSCGAEAFVSGVRLGRRKFRTGCTSMCETGWESDLQTEKTCMGIGCCQTSIPRNVWHVEVELRTNWSYIDVRDISNCSYAFLVEDSAFRFSLQNISNLESVENLPMLVDWVIDYGTCGEAKKNSTAYACRSDDSVCYEPENGDGYRCRCRDGYQGNPYLDDGCRDIDECVDTTRNKCLNKESCRNTAGDYTCSCNKGYYGDGREPNGCKDINECTGNNDCAKKAVCSNTDGDYTCSCPRGYSGNGRGVATGVILPLLAAMMVYFEHKRRSSEKTKKRFFHQNGGILLEEKLKGREGSADMVKIYSSIELRKATDEFHNDNIIGQGGFGTVYKGFLPGNRVVAIKRSKRVDPNEIEQFINEVLVLSQINHRNVVRLLGCCLETEVPLLVYEFINNGTLSSHLHNQEKARFLNWEMRLKIAAEAAGVHSYLHSAASTPIIHRDVKSDNILLDHTFTARVADFGASKLVPLDQTQLMTIVQGTFGYLDPEYMQTHQLTEKSDVYSFGVVLVELLTGRMAISNNRPEEERNLVIFFLFILKQGRLFEILDENIVRDDDENMDEVSEVANLAKVCLSVRGEDRPSMKEVAMELEGLIIGGKHKWARNVDNVEEMESLLQFGEEPNHFTNIGEGNSSSVGYDSIRDHVVLPISGGR
ncbi:hypothetical protein C2S51_019595 [Perilla frutescens var. frutescens]|nr:hypothetical protein C2S51_019595 [Perilla frutescens var. frutescens]